MYLSTAIAYGGGDLPENIVFSFYVYRVISNYIYLILITIFAAVSFEASKVEEASTRKDITFIHGLHHVFGHVFY